MWNTKIEEREITFVIQGKIQGNTINEVVSSILKNFPDSKIILSTWDYDRGNITHFVEKNVDEIIYNIDPGDHTEKDDKPININRQIVSSRAGIQAVKTKYCVKTRTDLLFTNSNLLTIDSSFERDQEYKVFSDWVHVLDVTTRSHLKYEKRLYWICDFVYFGITEDLKYIFDVKNFSKGDFIYLPENFKHRYKYSPETYLGLMSLQRDNGSE
ncbi:TPA: hypothetical protein LR347_004657, partial [Enterobacter hormaechei]|nr:hypothetical protein [Enterobacter hormaechei]